VKAIDTLWPLEAAPDSAVRIFRHVFVSGIDVDQPDAVAAELLGSLRGYRHPRLLLEGFFEAEPAPTAAYAHFLSTVVSIVHSKGYKFCGPVWGSGAFSGPIWAWFRAHQWFFMDAIALQAYWGNQGFTQWEALRYRTYWDKAVDPPLVIVECGRDDV
jgi:hypothetical protein